MPQQKPIKWKLVTKKVSELKPYSKNPRNITEQGLKDLKKSVDKFGLAELITINTNNIIIGGHARWQTLKANGTKECDCYIPNRKLNAKEVEELNIRLNKNIAGTWDFDILANEFEIDELLEWGFTKFDLSIDGQLKDQNNYSRKIESPTYKPTGKKPKVNELFDAEKYKALVNKIEESKIPQTIKDFLKISATRHIVFNYSNIAEFYSHSDYETQQLMEDSALVIIDFKKAIELGFVKLSEEIANQYLEEYGKN